MDVNMSTNIAEGYMIMEYKKRDLIKDGKLDPECYCRFLQHWPDYVRRSEGWFGRKRLLLDIELNTNELWERYAEYKKDIDRFVGYERTYPETPCDLMVLAGEVQSYCGFY
jgi:hypothetical protein